MKRKVWMVGLTLVTLALLAGGVAWAAETAQPPPRLGDHVVRGTVIEVGQDQVSVETSEGEEASLLLTETTSYWVPAEPPTKTLELVPGDPVLAFGRVAPADSDSEALTAWLVVVASDDELPRVLIRGRVVAVTRQTLVVQTGGRERAVTAVPRTRFRSPRGLPNSIRAVQVGDQIIALGQPTELGQWIAGLVMVIGPEPAAQRVVRGTVTDIDTEAEMLTVLTERRGEISVATDGETRFRIPGSENAGLADIAPGDQVVISGRPIEGDAGAFLARAVGVLAAP